MEDVRWLVVADVGGVQDVLELCMTWDDAMILHRSHAMRNRAAYRRIMILPNPTAVARALGWAVSPYTLARHIEECLRHASPNT